MCLLKGRESEECKHDWCHMAAQKPQYFALFKSDYVMNHEGLQQFKLSKNIRDQRLYILPVNPYSPGTNESRSFEAFRQSQQTFAYAFGEWPSDRDVFDKSEVEFVLVEKSLSGPINKYLNDGGPWHDTIDLTEVAIYCGPASDSEQEGAVHE
jgi:hypothetical protein